MSLITWIRDRLREPSLDGVDLDSAQLLQIQREILASKPLMLEVFVEIYETLRRADEELFSARGARVELGAGATFLQSMFPDVITTDLKFSPSLQLTASALELPFRDRSLRALYMINCFHHMPDPRALFREMIRALAEGGGCVMIDPYHGPLAAAFYRRIFATETFDRTSGWEREGRGAMTGANQALSWIVFERDRERFRAEFPQLRIVREEPLRSWVRYLLSGGLNFRPLVPRPLTPLARAAELALQPARGVLGLHHLIVLRKEPIQSPR